MLIMGAFVFSFLSQVGEDSKCLVSGMSPQTWHMFLAYSDWGHP